uniref:Uncharacterized protein n=1 Tax=Ditylenchus dipsaci TaxID=166011 RepID=A0A915E4J7_9BILA
MPFKIQQQLSGDASRLRTSAEIINNLQLEEKERRIVGLEHQIKLLEEANAELENSKIVRLLTRPLK